MKIEYIKLKDLFEEVKVFYSSYFESGLDLDETIILPKIRYLLRKFSLPIHNRTSEILTIENYKAELPDNFYKLELALGCFKRTEYMPPSPLSPIEVTECMTDYKINHCEVNACTNECGEYINIIQTVDGGTYYTYQDVEPLSISSKTHASCTGGCFNKNVRSDNEISIENNEIITNFCEGSVYIDYYQSLYEDGELLVPDDEIIRNALIENMKEVILEFLMINTTVPVSQVYQLQRQSAAVATREALNYLRTPEYADILNISRYYKRLFNRNYTNVVKNASTIQSRRFI